MYRLLRRARNRTSRIFPRLRPHPDLTLDTTMRYSITYDVVEAPGPGEEWGPEPDESGYEIERWSDDLRSIIQEAESYGCHPNISGSDPWYSEGSMDKNTGAVTTYAAHIEWPDGSPLTQFEVNQINIWWDEV